MRVMAAASLALVLTCLGCGAPGWVRRAPTSPHYIYAVGRWPKAYYENQRRRAAEEARSEIARVLHSRVNELIMLSQTRYSSSTIERLLRITSSVTEADLEGCEVVEYWKDEDGNIGAADTMYALARISREDARGAIHNAAGADLREEEQQALEQILQDLPRAVAESN